MKYLLFLHIGFHWRCISPPLDSIDLDFITSRLNQTTLDILTIKAVK